nr:SDR family oxidoreductase [Streptomyces sp. TLI_235]
MTGATGGIGRVTVLHLASRGWDVIAGARDPAKAADLTAHAERAGVRLRTVVLDVADPASCRQAVDQAEEMTAGGLWALVNNAGVPQAGAVADVGDEQARHVLEVNLLGAARLCRLVLPAMHRHGSGRIVNISSGLGRVPWPMGGWYSAAKHGLSALTHCLRVEAAHLGVQVCLVEPGAFATPMLATATADLAAVRTPGAPGYDRTTALFNAVDRRVPGPEPVARTIEKCLTATRPRPRYTVGRDARLLVPVHSLLPLRVTDLLKHAVCGLPRTAATRTQRAVPDGSTAARPPEPEPETAATARSAAPPTECAP